MTCFNLIRLRYITVVRQYKKRLVLLQNFAKKSLSTAFTKNKLKANHQIDIKKLTLIYFIMFEFQSQTHLGWRILQAGNVLGKK